MLTGYLIFCLIMLVLIIMIGFVEDKAVRNSHWEKWTPFYKDGIFWAVAFMLACPFVNILVFAVAISITIMAAIIGRMTKPQEDTRQDAV